MSIRVANGNIIMFRFSHVWPLLLLLAGALTGLVLAQEETPWSLRPLAKPRPPQVADGNWAQGPVDRFIQQGWVVGGLTPAPQAQPQVLLRRVYFDLTGLAPGPREMASFLADGSPDGWPRQVDRLLASPRHGERWARHWMDAIHFAETHGHDEDAVREHAWPYRDYLVDSFNRDKPYTRFIREQVAGDRLYPDDPQGIVALGFLAAGPWDESSQMGIQDGTIDKQIAQVLDRDDMIATVASSVLSLSVTCARCHDHKFDPITQKDYYSLQAVFAGLDRADRPYDPDPDLYARRQRLEARSLALEHAQDSDLLQDSQQEQVAAWEEQEKGSANRWVLLEPQEILSAGGAAFQKQPDGSVLFSGPRPEKETYTIRVSAPLGRLSAVRLEVLTDPSLPHQGPGRQDNGNLHLTQFKIMAAGPGATPEASQALEISGAVADFDQSGWTALHAVDSQPQTAWGIYPQVGQSHQVVFSLKEPLNLVPGTTLTLVLEQSHGGGHLIGRPRFTGTDSASPAELTPPLPGQIREILALAPAQRSQEQRVQLIRYVLSEKVRQERAALGPAALVYGVANDFQANGNFKPAKGARPVHVLNRGDIHQPLEEASPGALTCVQGLEGRFTLADPADESSRRAALAHWLTDPANPLPWRSIVNRIWQHHFGRGIVETSNDFGRMGSGPSHPELLEWLAVDFRDHGGSMKRLHRLLVTSAAYQQSSAHNEAASGVDGQNRLLWRFNRRRLDAEQTRDAILQSAGELDLRMGGPSARQFNSSPGVHVTPVLDYLGFDPDHPANRRRAIYRFIFRTLPDPLMEVLDCPDANQLVAQRTESASPLQALALLNSPFTIRQSQHFAHRLEAQSPELQAQVRRGWKIAIGRAPSPQEIQILSDYAQAHGLANACRMIFNTNEFIFLD